MALNLFTTPEIIFNKIKSKVKNCSITTDIIVAFPGETEEDFEDTLDVVRKSKDKFKIEGISANSSTDNSLLINLRTDSFQILLLFLFINFYL